MHSANRISPFRQLPDSGIHHPSRGLAVPVSARSGSAGLCTGRRVGTTKRVPDPGGSLAGQCTIVGACPVAPAASAGLTRWHQLLELVA
jgi:hypothetical protein